VDVGSRFIYGSARRLEGSDMKKLFGLAGAIVGLSLFAFASYAETYPSRTIKIVVAYPPGGPTDTVARVTTQGLGEALGQSAIIENIAGAGGRIGARDVARATPDGYTLFVGGTNDNAITPMIYSNLEYNPAKDFTAVAALAVDSNAIAVNPAVPVHSLAELASYSKANPGKVTAGGTVGIAPHLLLAYYIAKSGSDIMYIPYKGGAPAMTDVLGNQIQVFGSAKSILLPLAQAGKLRLLAVTSAKRWPELPDVPTIRESGYDQFPTEVWFNLMAPSATPTDILTKLNAAENARLKSPEVQNAITKLGLETRTFTQEDLNALLAKEQVLWQDVARTSGVHLE
jgi:tripartite-type tricarboxylate transporter receptor subunit TctC